jgi:hypothetical protein
MFAKAEFYAKLSLHHHRFSTVGKDTFKFFLH